MLAIVFTVQAAAVGAAWLLRSRERQLRRQLPYLVSLAVGVLLATALLHLLPEAVEALGNRRGLWLCVGGTLFVLFALERTVDTYTSHPDGTHAEIHVGTHAHAKDRAGALQPLNLLIASSLHSFVDGTAIATAFTVSPHLGLLTALAVGLHEVPHRLGDVAVLLHLGVAPARAMRFAVLAGVPALFGAGAVLLVGEAGTHAVRWLLPVSAASFLYIAGVNLLPELRASLSRWALLLQLGCLLGGVGIVLAVTALQGS